MSDPIGDEDAVLAANRALYDAFEARDVNAMTDLWSGHDAVFCTHPGWPTLHGHEAVVRSWQALLTNAQRLQFIVTSERAVVVGDAAWVTCDENILDSQLGGPTGGTVTALNVFRRRADGTWQLVGHHGSPVAG